MNLKSIIKQCVTEEINTPKWYLTENFKQTRIYPENFKSVRNYIRCLRRPATDEYVVMWYENGNTNDSVDAVKTFIRMKSEVDKENSSEHSHAPEMRVRSDEPQNDIHETGNLAKGNNAPNSEYNNSRWDEYWMDKSGNFKPYSEDITLFKKGFIRVIFSKFDKKAYYNTLTPLTQYQERELTKACEDHDYELEQDNTFTMTEGFDPQSMGVNCPMQPGESTNPYKAMNDKMRTMEEDNVTKGVSKQEKNPYVRKAMGMPSEDEDVDYVEYVSQRQGEEPFTLKTGNGQEKFEYVNGKYPSGKVDICVYAFRGDVCYGYNHFRKMFNLSESDITSVRPRDNGANIPREPEDAPNQYTKTNSKMSNMGNLEEGLLPHFDKDKLEQAYDNGWSHGDFLKANNKGRNKTGSIANNTPYAAAYSRGYLDGYDGVYNNTYKVEGEQRVNNNRLYEINLEESLPANFPNKLYRKLKSEYPHDDKAVYATAHKLSKKYGDKLNEIAEKSKCKCKNCGKLFEPHYGDYSKCSDCMN
jgi:hypothetical protein